MLTTPEASSAEMSTPGAEMNAAWLEFEPDHSESL
jgi:hypothetical protein